MRTTQTVLLLLALLAAPCAAQPDTGGVLFRYRPHAGERAAFEAGYRSHLDWHRQQADSLTWFGWDVLAGPGIGGFVDGVFGMPFAALDVRVDPAGDAADAATSFLPYATATARELVRLRADLSSATPLEAGTATPLVHAVRYEPRDRSDVEGALRMIREEGLLPYTVYETVAGGTPSRLVVLVWLERFADLDDVHIDPIRRLSAALGVAGTSELWRYRPTLTYQAATDKVR